MSKYGNKKVTVHGINFDSKMEAEYYLYLLELQARGEVKDIELQPKYLLQPAFKKNGKSIRKIEYIPDFKVTYIDGSTDVIDVKGMETSDFKLKKKMFQYKYPEDLKLMTHSKKWAGGWVELDDLKKIKREAKKKLK